MPAVCRHRHPGVPLRFLPESRRFSEGEAPPRHMGNLPQPSDRKRERPGMQNSRSKPPSGLLRPFFRQQYLPACLKARKQAVITRSSRSPDLRINSRRTAFSGSLPMTDFRHVRGLHAYSGGTVPDSHRIHYSPPKSTGISAALKRFLIYQNDTPIFPVCQEDLRIFRPFLSRPDKNADFFHFPLYKAKKFCYNKGRSEYGPVVQSVSTPACHAGGRRFESVPGRQKCHPFRDGIFLFP